MTRNKMTFKEMQEAFKPFKSREREYWSLDWRRDNPSEGGTTAIMFGNSLLDQTIRLEETKDKDYKVEIREGAEVVSSDVFEEFEKAKDYVINYMKTATTPPGEESLHKSKTMFEKLHMKSLIEQTNQRGIDKETHLFDEQTQEYLRILNLIINNENLEEDIINKSKKIRDCIVETIA